MSSASGSPRRYAELLADASRRVREVLPWHLQAMLSEVPPPLVLDVREPAEFGRLHIAGSMSVPRGVLEQACEWDYDETEPTLAADRIRTVVVVCRSGRRSLLAADTMQTLGFTDVASLKTGLRGWNDYEQPLVDSRGASVDGDVAEQWLASRIRPDQRQPGGR